jgi:malonyl-CoA O-methyltransferase
MARELVRMLEGIGCEEHFNRILEVGSGSGLLTGELLSVFDAGTYFANDLVDESSDYVREAATGRSVGETLFFQGDIESIENVPGELDLVVSNATVQWFDDLGGFFRKMSLSLKQGGLLAFSTFGTSNMMEIARLEDVALSYLTMEELRLLAADDFEIVVIREDFKRVEFVSPEAVLHHIRATGVNGLVRRAWTRSRYRQFVHDYRELFFSGSGVYLTYHPIYCCLRRKCS